MDEYIVSKDDDELTPIYANTVQITAGPFDVVLDFGFKSPEETRRGSPDATTAVRVAMSLSHAKVMLPMLAKVIAGYERAVGEIPAPGFDDQGKS